MKIYGITGMPLSGKTLVAEILEDEGYTVLDMGEVVRTEMARRDIEPEKTGEFANSMREKHGQDAIAILCLPYLEEIIEEKDKVVITGMRSWDEKKRFEEGIEPKIEIIAIWSPRETRKKRREERQREEDKKGDGFEERDWREVNYGVGKLMALSDHLIKNEGTVEQLEEEVKQIVTL